MLCSAAAVPSQPLSSATSSCFKVILSETWLMKELQRKIKPCRRKNHLELSMFGFLWTTEEKQIVFFLKEQACVARWLICSWISIVSYPVEQVQSEFPFFSPHFQFGFTQCVFEVEISCWLLVENTDWANLDRINIPNRNEATQPPPRRRSQSERSLQLVTKWQIRYLCLSRRIHGEGRSSVHHTQRAATSSRNVMLTFIKEEIILIKGVKVRCSGWFKWQQQTNKKWSAHQTQTFSYLKCFLISDTCKKQPIIKPPSFNTLQHESTTLHHRL